jgi:hypothetical protein
MSEATNPKFTAHISLGGYDGAPKTTPGRLHMATCAIHRKLYANCEIRG